MKRLIETWKAAREDGSLGELTYRMHGRHDRVHVEHGWWVQPSTFAFGIGYDDDWNSRYGQGRRSLAIEVGPFQWHLTVCQAVSQ